MSKIYIDTIIKHYENCLDTHGDSYLGVDWPKPGDALKRYSVMLEVIKFSGDNATKASVLDFGCGAGHLLQFIRENKLQNIEYTGIDISEKFISLCKTKFPSDNFFCIDILDANAGMPACDYIVMNGVFTEKREMSFEDMWQYFCAMLLKIFPFANKGIAFNVMSKAVDWEREDLFHMPADLLINFISKNLSRNFIIRNDYGLYEYTTYIYK